MARPEKNRNVFAPPIFKHFKPSGIRKNQLKNLLMSLDEYEALRLADHLGLEHNQAAEKMSISRPTFTRLISKARNKMAIFLMEGRSLQIEGGAVHFSQNNIKCLDCGNIYSDELNREMYICPDCGSDKNEDIARAFGHGRCCRKKWNNNNKENE
jgi:predicted DNA-binding protein (UPF0251 family)